MGAGGLILIVAVFALLWVLLIRPQRQRQLQQVQVQSSVSPGDEILTFGGLLGHVRDVGADDELIVEIAPGTNVRIARRGVAAVLTHDEPEQAALVEPGEPERG